MTTARYIVKLAGFASIKGADGTIHHIPKAKCLMRSVTTGKLTLGYYGVLAGLGTHEMAYWPTAAAAESGLIAEYYGGATIVEHCYTIERWM